MGVVAVPHHLWCACKAPAPIGLVPSLAPQAHQSMRVMGIAPDPFGFRRKGWSLASGVMVFNVTLSGGVPNICPIVLQIPKTPVDSLSVVPDSPRLHAGSRGGFVYREVCFVYEVHFYFFSGAW